MYCISVSHKKAPAAVREEFAFTAEEKEEFTRLLTGEEMIDGCVVLCTCNRSEIYVSGGRDAASVLQRRLSDYKKLPREKLLKYLNVYGGEQAAAHLFKVCCGFDSMVLGEDEILGQVKEAYRMALGLKAAGYELNVLFQRAVTCAKKIKTDTELSRTPLSIATLVANQVFHFEKEGMKRVLVIGMTGKMGSTIAKNLLSKPQIHVTGTVRSHRPEFLLEYRPDRVSVVDYGSRYESMEEADVVISATASPHCTVTCEGLRRAVRPGKKRLFIDVAVPMDIDSRIREIPGVSLYDIDYFETLSKNNTQIRLKELDRAMAIMEEELDEAIKEVEFHPYIQKLPALKAALRGKALDTVLFRIRDHLSSGDLKVILKTLDGLAAWMEEE